jgi:hypothetical protein
MRTAAKKPSLSQRISLTLRHAIWERDLSA